MQRTLKESHFRSIYLIGFSGSGKSSIGPLLARKLECKFFDTDIMIEKHCGKSIAQIFRGQGEKEFRIYETAIIRRLVRKSRQEKVVALGGGAFEIVQNRKMIANDGLIVYLSCPIRVLHRRLREAGDRPLLGGREVRGAALYERIRRIVLKRKQNYDKADLQLSTGNKTSSQAAGSIYCVIKKLYGNS